MPEVNEKVKAASPVSAAVEAKKKAQGLQFRRRFTK